ncbi:protein of unknown function [Methanoculleus bourgensis]|uniref:Uncharacterized protein n=1 Tax=Methanoculleus bourgensis TaxID=83986 RepID=A0A0X3BM88_9EURY|nr:protein of unknown function [Methanoculleus bourgensis]
MHLVEFLLPDIAPDPADLAGALDDPPAGGILKDIKHTLPELPGPHEEVLKAHPIRKQPEPEEVGVETRALRPDRPEIPRPVRNLDLHDMLDALAVAERVHETADPAYPLRHVDVLGVLALLHELLKPAVDVADGGDHIHHQLILKDEVEVDRLRQHRVLRPERHDYAFWHRSSPLLVTLNGNFSAVLMNVPLKSIFIPVTGIPKRSCSSFS